MNGALLAFGILLELAFLAACLALFARERSGARRLAEALIRRTQEPTAPPDLGIPALWPQSTAEIEAGLEPGANIDRAALAALRANAVHLSEMPLLLGLAIDLLLAGVALFPACFGLIRAARRLVDTQALSMELRPPKLYTTLIETTPSIFSELGSAFATSAVLSAGLALVFGVRWALLGSGARELNAHAAILRILAEGKHGRFARLTARLASGILPRSRPRALVGGAVVFVLLVTSAWSLLTAFAPLRAQRAELTPITSIWPDRRVTATDLDPKDVPSHPAGAPIRVGLPSLVITPSAAHVASVRLLSLEDGELPTDWKSSISNVGDTLESFRDNQGQLDVFVLAHREIGLRTLATLLEHMTTRYGVRQFYLLLRRDIQGAERVVQGAIPLQISKPEAAFTIAMDALAVGTRAASATVSVSLEGQNWHSVLRKQVWSEAGVSNERGTSEPTRIAVEATPDLTYDRFIDVLAAADSICGRSSPDCGVPGVGLEYSLILPLGEN